MKKLLKVLMITVLVIFVIVAGLLIYNHYSPNLAAWYLRNSSVFNGEVQYPSNYSELLSNAEVIKEIEYTDKYKTNTLSLVYPKDTDKKVPVIIWAHGGAFVAGNNEGTLPFSVMLSNEGYAFVSLNYNLAPEHKYPDPVFQVAEVVDYLYANKEKYPFLDVENVFFGGDSAGAQIIAQFLNTQTNSELQRIMGMKQVIEIENIKGALLYCGPYSMDRLAEVSNQTIKQVMGKLGWAYFGMRDWENSEEVMQADIVTHVNENFPPAYITDGNNITFTNHGIELVEKLESLDIEVMSLFFETEKEINHEYQFNFEQYPEESMESFKLTLEFLNKYR